MTAQRPEILIVDAEKFRLPATKLYAVCVGDIDEPTSSSRYNFQTQGNQAKMTVCTALWRGYISTYRLRADGTLILERLEYPFTKGAAPDEVLEVIHGDFWLDLRESFLGRGMRIPFVDGKIITDESLWRRREALRGRI
jgi:hypothetical protein